MLFLHPIPGLLLVFILVELYRNTDLHHVKWQQLSNRSMLIENVDRADPGATIEPLYRSPHLGDERQDDGQECLA